MKYFSEKEFACPCCGQNKMNQAVKDSLDSARHDAGIPFIITSGYRCKKHNTEVGGSEFSSHMNGTAVDISVLNSQHRYIILVTLLAEGFNRIGIGSNFIHADMDRSKPGDVVWHYYGEEK